MKSELQNSYGFEYELNKLGSSLDEFLRCPNFGIIFLQKKKLNIIKHAFLGSSGNSGGDLEERGVLNSIPRGIGE